MQPLAGTLVVDLTWYVLGPSPRAGHDLTNLDRAGALASVPANPPLPISEWPAVP